MSATAPYHPPGHYGRGVLPAARVRPCSSFRRPIVDPRNRSSRKSSCRNDDRDQRSESGSVSISRSPESTEVSRPVDWVRPLSPFGVTKRTGKNRPLQVIPERKQMRPLGGPEATPHRSGSRLAQGAFCARRSDAQLGLGGARRSAGGLVLAGLAGFRLRPAWPASR